MQSWITFYEVLAGASATLLGLLFVSVSVNAHVILGEGHAHSRRLAEQAFQNYLLVLLISLLVFIPGFGEHDFAVTTLPLTLFRGVLMAPRLYLTIATRGNETGRKSFRRYLATIIGFVMVIYACVYMLLGKDELTLAASGLIVLVLAATVSAWELLVRVARADRMRD